MLTALTALTSCSGASGVFDKIMGAPTYTGTVVSKHISEDEVTLYKVTLDKFSLYNYYIVPLDIEHEEPYMTVRYDAEEKTKWIVDGKEVTNHGYVFVKWGKTEVETTTSSSYIEVEVE